MNLFVLTSMGNHENVKVKSTVAYTIPGERQRQKGRNRRLIIERLGPCRPDQGFKSLDQEYGVPVSRAGVSLAGTGCELNVSFSGSPSESGRTCGEGWSLSPARGSS